MCRRLLPALLLALLTGPGAGCIEVSGGAVEARWDLRNADGVRIGCPATPVAALRFALVAVEGGSDPCESDPACRFACELGVGSTRFTIPAAEYAMGLQALDQDGQPLGSAQGVVAPGPVLRRVEIGEVTDLSVNLIIVDR